MAYREVMMLEVKEVLRLWLSGMPKRQVATQLGLDVKTVRRYLSAAQAAGLVREQGTGARRRARRVGAGGGTPAARPATWRQLGALRVAAGSNRALPRRAHPALQSRQAPRAPGHPGRLPDAAPLRDRGAGLRPHGAHGPRRRLRAWRGAPARHWLDDALGAGPLRHASPVPRLDLHGGPLAAPLRLSCFPRDDGH